MCREPCLDIDATLCRQFVVDVGVQFVFGDGDLRVGHGRYLCVISSVSLRAAVIPEGARSWRRHCTADTRRCLAPVLHHPSRPPEAGGAPAPPAPQFRTTPPNPLPTHKAYVPHPPPPHP